MLKVLVTKLWQGQYVSVKDYQVTKAIQQGGLQIEHNGKFMDLTPDELKKLKPTGRSIVSKFKGRYRLVDIEFKPITENPNQKKFNFND